MVVHRTMQDNMEDSTRNNIDERMKDIAAEGVTERMAECTRMTNGMMDHVTDRKWMERMRGKCSGELSHSAMENLRNSVDGDHYKER